MQKVILINEMDYEIPDIQGYMAGDEDYPVTDLGILRAKITKTELPSTEDPVILTSPLQRCRMAAEEIFGSAEEEENLRDAHLGLWQGCGLDEIQEKWPKEYKEWLYNPVMLPPEAETFEHRAQRLENVLLRTLQSHSGDVVVFTHSGIIVPFLSRLQQIPEDKMTSVRIPYGAVCQLEWDGSSLQVISNGEQIIPELSEQLEQLILDHYNVSDTERQRCRTVGEIAYELADRLSETGLLLDADTVRWAARLQSIGGTDPSGAEIGSRILETMGYPDEAFAVLNHIDLFFRSIINEAVVLYLANRQVPDKEVLPFPEVFRRDRECSDSTTEDRIAQDTVIINMINTLYGEDLLPLE